MQEQIGDGFRASIGLGGEILFNLGMVPSADKLVEGVVPVAARQRHGELCHKWRVDIRFSIRSQWRSWPGCMVFRSDLRFYLGNW